MSVLIFWIGLLYSWKCRCYLDPVSSFCCIKIYVEKKSRPRKTKRGGGAGGGGRREARLSPLHESAMAGGQHRTAGGGGIRPITRGRSASEYIPRSKGKDHLPEIPAMSIRPSEEARSSSLSSKVAVPTTPTSPPPASVSTTTTTATATAAEQRSPSRDKKDQSTSATDRPVSGGTTGTEEVLEASVDFARNVRGTSTPIDISPDLGNNNRSQTFNGAADVTNTSDTGDRKPPTANGAPETVNLADSIDTQQIELSLVDDSEGHSSAPSTSGTGVDKIPPSPKTQSWI